MHAVYKNSQVKTARLIDQAEERIEQTEVKIRMIGVNTDELLDRFDMRERLQENGSTLIAITPADIEEIAPPLSSPKRPAARALP
jgi:hypothetical protein